MLLDILPLAGGAARLVRVYGGEPCAVLPGAVPGPEGGEWPITELGDYCFSEKPRGLPGPEKTCRYEQAEDGTLRLTRAFGREVGGRARYSFDFDAPAASAQDDDLHPVCGNFLEEVSLPDSLRVVGSCAFYNCRKLRRLSAGAGELTMGSDVFLNCFALEDLIVRAAPEQPTGLFALVGSITEAVRALFWPVGEASPRAGLWYPAYWEDIEETPAHILLHTKTVSYTHLDVYKRQAEEKAAEEEAMEAVENGPLTEERRQELLKIRRDGLNARRCLLYTSESR